ncbi:DUF1540 domain-containing protein [Arthrobacter pityocampae]|uniref:DUF1540 domain-containing protein n=1 Tax=Arthrobacter pityocampae TaxID=547334 RepID=A0A2S5J0Q1_9MICC|nr:DUF1540 domain-containing protein [Arthrobacter pityocampae]PPB50399.1 DUF1540 domain-containing protein [Arthrobacter pityocampae]
MTDMISVTDSPSVTECSVRACSFNHNGCNAVAITVSGSEDHASCATFIDTAVSGGLPKIIAHVGACQRSECRYNHDLLCGAPAIRVGPGADAADCLTYTRA